MNLQFNADNPDERQKALDAVQSFLFKTKGDIKLVVEKNGDTRKEKTNAYFNILAKAFSSLTSYSEKESKALIFKYADAGITRTVKMPNGDFLEIFVRESTALINEMTEERLIEIIGKTKQLFIDLGIPQPIPPQELAKYL